MTEPASLAEPNRRTFMKLAGLAPAIAAAPVGLALTGYPVSAFAQAATSVAAMRPGTGPAIPRWPEPMQTRQIWLRRQETGEEVVARYYENGQLRMNDYLAVCSLLRDVRAKLVAHIDIELMDLMFAIQNWLVSWGIDVAMLVTSGYRSPGTNSRLEGAARNSLHLQGRAADIRMPGVPTQYLGRLAAIFGVGGVGFYTQRNFNHIDTGNVRYWKGR